MKACRPVSALSLCRSCRRPNREFCSTFFGRPPLPRKAEVFLRNSLHPTTYRQAVRFQTTVNEEKKSTTWDSWADETVESTVVEDSAPANESTGTYDGISAGFTRETFFIGLRSLLLEDKVSASNVWKYIKTSRWWNSGFLSSEITPAETSLLTEALYANFQENFKTTSGSSPSVDLPIGAFRAYSSRGLIGEGEWSSCIGFMAKVVYEAILDFETYSLEERVVRLLDTQRMFFHLHNSWKAFLLSHQLGAVENAPKEYVWSWLRLHPAQDLSNTSDYAERLFAFAPGWQTGKDQPASQQLVCASLITLVASSKFLLYVTSARSIVDNSPSALDRPSRGPWSQLDLKTLSDSELAFRYIVCQSADSTGVNAIMLRLALSRLSLSPSGAESLVASLKTLKSDAIDLLCRQRKFHDSLIIRFDNQAKVKADRVLTVLVVTALSARTLDDLDTLRKAYSLVSQRPSMDLTRVARALCRKYWELSAPKQALELWNEIPALRTSSHLLEKTLAHHYNANDLQSFEAAWHLAELRINPIPENLWRMRLKLIFHHNPLAAEACFVDATRPVTREVASTNNSVRQNITTETLNMMIDMLLRAGLRSRARDYFRLLKEDSIVKPDRHTYLLLIRDAIKNDFTKEAYQLALELHAQNLGNPNNEDSCRFFLTRLAHWPYSATYADPAAIGNLISVALHFRFRGSYETWQDPTLQDKRRVVAEFLEDIDSPPEETEYSSSREKLQISRRSEAVARLRMSQELEADVRLLYLELFRSIVRDLSGFQRIRLALLLHQHQQSLLPKRSRDAEVVTEEPATTKKDKVLLRSEVESFLYSLPRNEVLALLNGDVHSADGGPYLNFTFVWGYFGPRFIADHLCSIGCEEFSDKLLSMKWPGFARFDQQYLIDAGIISARARASILSEVKKLQREALLFKVQRQRGGASASNPLQSSSKSHRKEYFVTPQLKSIAGSNKSTRDIEALKALRRRLTTERLDLSTKRGLENPKSRKRKRAKNEVPP